MTESAAPIYFRATIPCLLSAMVLPLLLGALSIVVLLLNGPLGWAIFSAASVLSLFALVETLTEHVVLAPDRLQFCRFFNTTVIPKAEIVKVVLTPGGGATVGTSSGRWLMIPDLGHGAHIVTDAINAWLEGAEPARSTPDS